MNDSRATVLLILAHAKLTVYETEVLFFRYCDKMTFCELADHIHPGVSKQAVEIAHRKGLLKLRKIFLRRFDNIS